MFHSNHFIHYKGIMIIRAPWKELDWKKTRTLLFFFPIYYNLLYQIKCDNFMHFVDF